jgi:hypothetical protein
MRKKIFSTLMSAALLSLLPLMASAQQAEDQYGFGNRVFLIQSSLEVGRSANGLWDIPGTPNKTNGNLKGTKWLHMGVWEREKGDPEDRVFRFRPAQGSAAGRYFINVGRNTSWGVNGIDGTGAVEARTRSDHFELKHVGNGRWKIYYKPGIIVCLEKPTAKNGTKLVLRPDQNGPHAEWVFFDIATNKSFAPVSAPVATVSYKGTLKDNGIPGMAAGAYQYFEYADGAKFMSENVNGELQNYLNDVGGETSKQWNYILGAVKTICRNKDLAARQAMYRALSEVNIKKGNGFLEGALSGQVAKQINDIASREKDAAAKGHLKTLAG